MLEVTGVVSGRAGIQTYVSPELKTTFIMLSPWSLVAQRLKRLPPSRETQVRSLGREDPLEKEMEIHSSILAWRVPWTEKPSRLQSMGSQRVGHDFTFTFSMVLKHSFPGHSLSETHLPTDMPRAAASLNKHSLSNLSQTLCWMLERKEWMIPDVKRLTD